MARDKEILSKTMKHKIAKDVNACVRVVEKMIFDECMDDFT